LRRTSPSTAAAHTERHVQRCAPATILPCKDGHVWMLALEPGQWNGLARVMGKPEWMTVDIFQDMYQRAQNADAIYPLLVEWTMEHGKREIMDRCQAEGVPVERVLIKVASTWEGIQAAAELEREGIRCNLTLLFAFCQAVACGANGIQLISPFVGRIYDWYKKQAGAKWDEAAQAGANDPGVQSVTRIFNYYKKFGIRTEVMGASFRNIGQIRALAGCDLLTISPDLLAQLQASDSPLPRVLDPERARQTSTHAATFNEAAFRYALNDDAMASDKLAEGIRTFAADAAKLEKLIEEIQ